MLNLRNDLEIIASYQQSKNSLLAINGNKCESPNIYKSSPTSVQLDCNDNTI